LVHVLDHPGDGLVFVNHAVDTEAPNGRAAQRREQHAPHRVAERVAEAALEWLEPEFCNVRVVVALGRFNQLRTNQPGEIDDLWHFLRYPERSYRDIASATPHPAPSARWARNGTRARTKQGDGRREAGDAVCRSVSRFPSPASRFTSSTTRLPTAPAPRSGCWSSAGARAFVH